MDQKADGLGKAGGIRLYVNEDLGAGQDVELSREQSHYLFGVMRRALGDGVRVFNGRDGEWQASVAKAGKSGVLKLVERMRDQVTLPDIQLLFAPVKKARTDFIIEKAVELGVSRISPVFTEFTNSERIRPDRMEKIAIEAAEQSEGLNIPRIDEGMKLVRALDQVEAGRKIVVLNETETGVGTLRMLSGLSMPVALLVGPEGGFSPAELKDLEGRDQVVSISLGPRILRADTAVVAGLTLIQSGLGDWT